MAREQQDLNQDPNSRNCLPERIEVYNITYSDCPTDPWTICRCSDADLPLTTVAKNFGQVPPAIRSHVRHIFVMNGTWTPAGQSPRSSGRARTGDDNTAIWGPAEQFIFLHEAIHTVNQHFSDTALWRNAMGNDTCLPSVMSSLSPAEDLAEAAVLYAYGANTNAVYDLAINTNCLANRLKAVGDHMGNDLNFKTSTCSARRPNTPIVTPSISKRTSRKITTKSLSSMDIIFSSQHGWY